MQPFQVPAQASATICHPSQSVRETGLGSMPVSAVIFTSSSPITRRMRPVTEAMESEGFRRRFDTMEAVGGITFGAWLPRICVNATVVRSSALSSPPVFRVSRSRTQPKAQRLAKIIR